MIYNTNAASFVVNELPLRLEKSKMPTIFDTGLSGMAVVLGRPFLDGNVMTNDADRRKVQVAT